MHRRRVRFLAVTAGLALAAATVASLAAVPPPAVAVSPVAESVASRTAQAAVPSSMEEIYAAVAIENLRAGKPTYAPGEKPVFTFDLVNRGPSVLVVPFGPDGAEPTVGEFRAWIERRGSDPGIPDLRACRDGRRYSASEPWCYTPHDPNPTLGGTVQELAPTYTWAKGRALHRTIGVEWNIVSYPVGDYSFSVEHMPLDRPDVRPDLVTPIRSATVDFSVAGIAPPQLHLAATQVVWTDADLWGTATAAVFGANADGSDVHPIAGPPRRGAGYIAAGQGWRLYWTETDPVPAIRRVHLDGRYMDTAAVTGGAPLGITWRNGGPVWTDAARHEVASASGDPLSPTYASVLATGLSGTTPPSISSPQDIAYETNANEFYWANPALHKIQRLTDSSPYTVEDAVVSGVTSPAGIVIDADHLRVYWTDGSEIRRAFLDGTSVETVLPGLAAPHGIDIDPAAGKLYWAETGTAAGTGRIRRSNLDGTSVEDLITGLASPWGLALVIPAARTATVPYIGGAYSGWAHVRLPTGGTSGPSGEATGVAAGGPGVVVVGSASEGACCGGPCPPGGTCGPVPASWTSADGGRSWTEHPVPEASTEGDGRGFLALASRSGILVAGAASGFWRSADGITWTRAASGPRFAAGTQVQIVAGLRGFVALAKERSSKTTRAWVSADGLTWRQASAQPALAGFCAVGLAASAARAVAVGDDCTDRHRPRIVVSTDGQTWRRAPTQSTFSRSLGFQSVSFVGGRFLLFGAYRSVTEGTAVWSSRDGLTWRRTAFLPEATPADYYQPDAIAGVVRLGSAWVALGHRYDEGVDWQPVAWTSPDLVHWSRQTIGGSGWLVDVTAVDGRLFAAGTWNVLAESGALVVTGEVLPPD
ncbi:MAG: hypothetical protein WCH74_12375 [Chloroflexota bacterium]